MKIFVLMPFQDIFNDVYEFIKRAVHNAIEGEEFECLRVDERKGAGSIISDIRTEIETSTICIADITGTTNQNVMWEVGYASALKKPVILICEKLSEIPFNIKDMHIIKYDRTNLTASLKSELRESIKQTLVRYQVPRVKTQITTPDDSAYSIAITGSMSAEPSLVKQKIPNILNPYLDNNTKWYIGSVGTVDELVGEYLGKNEQKVNVVGYNEYDISSRMLDIVKKYSFPFIDAQKKHMPKTFVAPSQRDYIFYTSSNLVILLWNGVSPGTKELILWYQDNQKDLIISFV